MKNLQEEYNNPRVRYSSSARSSSKIHFWAVLLTFLMIAVLASCSPISTNESTSEGANTSSDVEVTTEATVEASEAASEDTQDGSQGSAGMLPVAERVGMYDAPPEMSIDTSKHYYATIRTEKGDLKVQLFADRAPITVNNFVFLAEEGYYDDTTFHRVMDDFMAQGGDPGATGTGGPGYVFEDEFDPSLTFDSAGLLGMANTGPGSNGSQFFITFGPTDWLTGMHTIFGKVIEGEEVLDEITRIDPLTDTDMVGDTIYGIDIEVSDESVLPTPLPPAPTPTPTPTPTPFAPTDMDTENRPLGELDPAERAGYFNTAPEMSLNPDAEYSATIVTTQGDIEVELFADSAPSAVNNFVVLSKLGFFDNTPINLIRPDDSMIFGSPNNDPAGDAGYQYEAEVNLDTEMAIGVIANMPTAEATDGTVMSNSSQILVALVEPPAEFSGILGFFGQVTEGMDVLSSLTMDDMIESIEITASEE